jgi:CRP/FNR family transcriptional regulator
MEKQHATLNRPLIKQEYAMGSIHALHQTVKPQGITRPLNGGAGPRHAGGLLAGLGADTRARLEQLIGRPKILQRGQRLFTAGGNGDCLYLINSGSFKAHLDSDSGEEQITGFHFANELLGFDALENGKHSYTVEALETSSICRVPFTALQELSSGDPQLQRLLLTMMSRQIGNEQSTIFMLGRMSAEQRLAQFLLKLSQVRQESGCIHDQISLSMQRNDIANYLGLALETISRLLQRFQNSGLLKVAHRDVRLLDIAGLKNIVAHGQNQLARAH